MGQEHGAHQVGPNDIELAGNVLLGAFLGDVHASMLQAMGCIGYVTNGAVRELPALRRMGFHIYARNVALSHAYARIIDFGSEVQIGGMEVHPGDLL